MNTMLEVRSTCAPNLQLGLPTRSLWSPSNWTDLPTDLPTDLLTDLPTDLPTRTFVSAGHPI